MCHNKYNRYYSNILELSIHIVVVQKYESCDNKRHYRDYKQLNFFKYYIKSFLNIKNNKKKIYLYLHRTNIKLKYYLT